MTQYEIHANDNGYALTMVSDSGEWQIGTYTSSNEAKQAAQSDKGKKVRWTECGSSPSAWYEGG